MEQLEVRHFSSFPVNGDNVAERHTTLFCICIQSRDEPSNFSEFESLTS